MVKRFGRRLSWIAGVCLWAVLSLAARSSAAELLVVLRPAASADAGSWSAAAPRSSLKSLVPPHSGAYGRFWKLDSDRVTPAQLQALSRDPLVVYLGPNRFLPVDPLIREAYSSPGKRPDQAVHTAPDDLLFPNQEALKAVRAPQAWETATGQGILIAIVDTGVDLDHPDLEANLYVNIAERDGLPDLDDDGNGYVDDVHGYDFTDAPLFPGVGDFVDRDADPSDDHGHGTTVAGVAAAVWNNGVGIAGAAPQATILPVRAGLRTNLPFLSAILQEDDAAAAIIYAADQGAHIINASWGDVVDSPVLQAAIQYAQDLGVLVVASSGNDSGNMAHFPTGQPGVLGVGATDFKGVPTNFTTYGHDLDVMAPGLHVLAPVLNGGWDSFSGTSISAPLASGVSALVWSAHPQWTAAQVAWRVMETARRADGWTLETGWGLVDAEAAVAPDRGDPFSLELTGLVPEGAAWSIHGEALGASLIHWQLLAERVDGSEDRTLTPLTYEPAAGLLGWWEPAEGDTAEWVVRLEALYGEADRKERRLRLRPKPTLEIDHFQTQFQIGRKGWDLVLTWESEAPHQGAAFLSPEGIETQQPVVWKEETAVGTHHALRLPLAPNVTQALTVLGRMPQGLSYSLLNTVSTVRTPFTPHVDTRENAFDLPPGSMLGEQSDVDGDGRPELIYESAFDNDSATYGRVRFTELEESLTAVSGDDFLADYRGIPLGIGDLDGDDRLEILVFRVDAWSIYEAAEPGAFPTVPIFTSTTDSPLGLVKETGELLSVSGKTLRVWVPSGNTFVLSREVESTGLDLLRQAVWGDVDEDGEVEVFVTDASGRLAVFGLDNHGGASLLATSVNPMVGRHLVLVGLELVTTRQVPAILAFEGDAERLATRVEAWMWKGGRFKAVSTLSLSGNTVRSVVPWGSALWIARRGRWDKLDLASHLSWVDGFVEGEAESLVTQGVPVRSAVREGLLVGAFYSESTKLYPVDSTHLSPEGVQPRVISWTQAVQGIVLNIQWSFDTCPVTRVERRAGDVVLDVPFTGAALADTVSPGETVTYVFFSQSCAPRRLDVTGIGSETPRLTWISNRNLEALWDTPVPLEALGRVQVHADGVWSQPLAVNQAQDGAQFVVAIPQAFSRVDSIQFGSYWNVYGLPLGGSLLSRFALPERPETPEAFIKEAIYKAADLEILVDFEGVDGCDALSFVLNPGGLLLEGRSGDPVRLRLNRTLPPGSYSLEYTGGCPAVLRGGTQARFAVGVIAFPNPVGTERQLWITNLAAETRVELVDVAGRTVRRWPGLGANENARHRFDLRGLASGLYVVGIHPPGAPTQWKKLALQ